MEVKAVLKTATPEQAKVEPAWERCRPPFGRVAQLTAAGRTFPQVKHGAARSMESGNTSAMLEGPASLQYFDSISAFCPRDRPSLAATQGR